MDAYKFLAAGAVGPFSGFAWPEPGTWVEAEGPVVVCRSGVHGVERDAACEWLDEELWRVELDGDLLRCEGVVAASRGRLVSRIEAWNRDAARAFALACAERLRARAQESEAIAPFAAGAEASIAAGDVPRLAAVVSYSARHAAEQAEPGGWASERAWQTERLAELAGL